MIQTADYTFKANIIREDGYRIGTMPLQLGMVLSSGQKVVKINQQSVKTEDGDLLYRPFTIYIFEARKFNFSKIGEEIPAPTPFMPDHAVGNGKTWFQNKQPLPETAHPAFQTGYGLGAHFQRMDELKAQLLEDACDLAIRLYSQPL